MNHDFSSYFVVFYDPLLYFLAINSLLRECQHVLEQSEIFYLVKFLHYFIIFSNIGNTIAKLFSLKIKWKF